MKVIINNDLCIGCALCVSLADQVFEMNGEGKAIIRDNAEYDQYKDSVGEAAQACAVGAISHEQ